MIMNYLMKINTKDIFKELENKNFNLIERYTSPEALINSTELCISMSFATQGLRLYIQKIKVFLLIWGQIMKILL